MMKIKKDRPILPKVIIEDEPWINRYWRPMMAWQYFLVCLCDFIIFPSISMYYAAHYAVESQWKWDPITLTAGGFYHIAMGIIIGVSAYSRGQENLLRTRLFAGMQTPYSPQSSPQCGEGDDLYAEGMDPPAHPSINPREDNRKDWK